MHCAAACTCRCRRTPCGMPSPRTCSITVRTCGPCSCCWGTPTSPPPPSTRTWRASGCELHGTRARTGQGVDGHLLALCIQLAHAPQMAQQMPFENEAGKNVLLGARAVTVAQCLGRGEGIDERVGQDDEAETQAWMQR